MRSASHTFLRKPVARYLLACLSAIALFSSPIGAGSLVIPALDRTRGTECSSPIQQATSQQRIPGQAPQKTGALQGAVRDGGEVPVVAASVALRNIATGQEQRKSSDAQGVFRFIDVLPGQYELSVDAPGYAKFTEDGIQVNAGSVVIREIKLTPIPITVAPSTALPQLPPRAAPNNVAAGEGPPAVGYPEMKYA